MAATRRVIVTAFLLVFNCALGKPLARPELQAPSHEGNVTVFPGSVLNINPTAHVAVQGWLLIGGDEHASMMIASNASVDVEAGSQLQVYSGQMLIFEDASVTVDSASAGIGGLLVVNSDAQFYIALETSLDMDDSSYLYLGPRALFDLEDDSDADLEQSRLIMMEDAKLTANPDVDFIMEMSAVTMQERSAINVVRAAFTVVNSTMMMDSDSTINIDGSLELMGAEVIMDIFSSIENEGDLHVQGVIHLGMQAKLTTARDTTLQVAVDGAISIDNFASLAVNNGDCTVTGSIEVTSGDNVDLCDFPQQITCSTACVKK